MPKGFVVLTERIKDPEAMKAYGRAAAPLMAQASILAVDTQPQLLEGEWHGDQTVILEFESVQAAREWYDSPSYQEAKQLRTTAADCNVVILSGFEMPSPRS